MTLESKKDFLKTATFDVLSEATCVTNKNDRILAINSAFKKQFGDREGKSLKPVCKVLKKHYFNDEMHTGSVEFEVNTPLKKKHFILVRTPLNIDGKKLFINELKDITEEHDMTLDLKNYLRKVEDEVKRRTEILRAKVQESEMEKSEMIKMIDSLNTAYEELQKDAINKNELFDITSHELKTPLVPIAGFAEVLLSNKTMGDVEKKYVKVIKSNVFRLKSLLENIIELSKIHAGKAQFNIKKNNLYDIIKEAIDSVDPLAKLKDMKINFKVPDVQIRCDNQKCHQMISHILENAIKFSNEKTPIEIRAKKSRDAVTISISDKGIGIPEEFQEKIFEKFTQVDSSNDRSIGGAGLGLPLCRAIVEAHRGKIWCESDGKTGTTFFIKLPLNMRTVNEQLTNMYGKTIEKIEQEKDRLAKERVDIMTRI